MLECKQMKELGETSPFHRFTNPQHDKLVYFWSWCSYLQFMHQSFVTTAPNLGGIAGDKDFFCQMFRGQHLQATLDNF